jgi:hypothetical protein
MAEKPPKRKGDAPDLLARVETMPLRASRGFTWVERANAVTSLLLFLGVLFGLQHRAPIWADISVGWLCVLTATAVAMVVVQDRRSRRRGRYAVALERVHKAIHLIRDAEAGILLHDVPLTNTVPVISQVLTATAGAFTAIAGASCRACIKQVHYPAAQHMPVQNADSLRDLKVSTMCRDEATGRTASDDKDAFVDRNTDFEMLFLHRETSSWFVANNLATYAGSHPYKNSSCDGELPDD